VEVVEDFAVGRSVNVWAINGRGWLVINIHELGKHWESGIVEKEGRRRGWIARWVVIVEGIAHGCWVVAGRESKRAGMTELADNALEGPNTQVVRNGVEGWRRSGSSGEGHGIGWAVLYLELPLNGSRDNSRPASLIGQW